MSDDPAAGGAPYDGPTAGSGPYVRRRRELASFFEAGSERWDRISSEEEDVGFIRRTVRSGRRRMRHVLTGWLPDDLDGRRVLDAGCGTGLIATELARRGADVVAVDVAPSMIRNARRRTPGEFDPRIDYRVADMLDPDLGRFDHVVAMDSLIHYGEDELVEALGELGGRAERSVVFTFAPRTPFLGAMHAVGRLLPSSKKAPSIRPIDPERLPRSAAGRTGMEAARRERIRAGFYISQGVELVREGAGAGAPGTGVDAA